MRLFTWFRRSPERGPTVDGPSAPSTAELLDRVRAIELRARRLVDDLFLGEYHAIFRGSGVEFDEIRPYVPGDDIRDIDWKTFARSGQPFIRRYREDRDLTVVFLVDTSASTFAGALPRSKRDVIAELSAVLGLAAIRNNDRVGALLFAGRPERYLRPASGSTHVLRVIREILDAQPSSRSTSLEAALEYLDGVQKRHATIFLLSDFIDRGYDRGLRALARKHDIIPVVVREDLDAALPPAGLALVADAETGRSRTVDLADRRVRDAYAAHLRRIDEERRGLFGELALDPIEVTVGEDYVPVLLRFFRRRASRRAS